MQTTSNLDELKQDEPAPEPGAPTALTTTEEPIIDAEVKEVLEPEHKPTPKPRPYYLIVVVTILVCLLFVAVSLIVPLFTPSATITIIPREEHIALTAAIPIQGRVLPALTLSQSQTTKATGRRHQDATRATGEITFYNGLFTSQTIASGTIFTGADGVQVITDQPAVIPAGNPPIYGQVTVSAHALMVGASGNIAAYDIQTACCLTSVLAKNTTAFTGGADAREYVVVTHHDIDVTAAIIQTSLAKSEQAALQAQLNPGEGLVSPSCNPKVTTDHQAGDEAKEVHVMVSETCSGIAYIAHDVYQKATQMIHQEAIKRLGTGYSVIGDVQVSIIHATITDQEQGMATLVVKVDVTYVYQLSEGKKQHLVKLIAGKTNQQAIQDLLHVPGVQAVSVISHAETLPDDPGRITIVVVYRSA